MSGKKRRNGHYCKVCSEYKSNESFSGKGHANHICKRCSKKSPVEQAADMTLSKLYNMPFRKLNQVEKIWLENRINDQREEIKIAAQEVYNHMFPYAERNKRKKQLHIGKLSFRINTKVYDEFGDVQNVNCLFEVDKLIGSIVKTVYSSDESPLSRHEVSIFKADLAKFLKWIVHSLEIFEWEQDYCLNDDRYDLYNDGLFCSDEVCVPERKGKEPCNDLSQKVTWQVDVDYSIGTVQKTYGIHDYLPDKVNELYCGFEEYFIPPDCEES